MSTRTAKAVAVYGMRPVGGFGVRGFRAHCGECGYLSRLYDNVMGCERRSQRHRCGDGR